MQNPFRYTRSQIGKIVSEQPPGQSLCRDGLYSTYARGPGRCSYHGGVMFGQMATPSNAQGPEANFPASCYYSERTGKTYTGKPTFDYILKKLKAAGAKVRYQTQKLSSSNSVVYWKIYTGHVFPDGMELAIHIDNQKDQGILLHTGQGATRHRCEEADTVIALFLNEYKTTQEQTKQFDDPVFPQTVEQKALFLRRKLAKQIGMDGLTVQQWMRDEIYIKHKDQSVLYRIGQALLGCMTDQEEWKKRLLIFGPGIELKWDIDEILKCDFTVPPPAYPPAHPLAGVYNDIPYQQAYGAYRASSFYPERRANDDIKSYANYLINTYTELSKGRTPEQQNQLDTWFRTFRKKYREQYLAWEGARGRTASAFVVGPANFPTRSNQKKLATADRRYQELIDYQNKALARVKKDPEIYPENKVSQPIQSGAGDALERLKQKLTAEERNHALMKEINRIIRSNKEATYAELLPQLKAAGLAAEAAAKILVPDYAGRIGFKGFELTNSNQRIRNLKERIAEEEKIRSRRETGAQKKSFDGGFVEEDTADNRLRIYFDDIPPADLRSRLKRSGWRWSRQNMAWQRQATDNAWRSAKDILGIAGLPGKWRPYVV